MIFLNPFIRYMDFAGRSNRTELLAWAATLFVLGFLTALVDPSGTLNGLLVLALVIPHLAIMVRRLHDTDRSGWLFLLAVVPFANIYLLVILYFILGLKVIKNTDLNLLSGGFRTFRVLYAQ